MEHIREIRFYKSYFKDFYVSQKQSVRDKINYVLMLVETQVRIPVKFFRQIEKEDGLYEIRVELDGNIFRIFCCFDEGAIVVLFNCFQKKSAKTPRREIEKAVSIKNDYFRTKKR